MRSLYGLSWVFLGAIEKLFYMCSKALVLNTRIRWFYLFLHGVATVSDVFPCFKGICFFEKGIITTVKTTLEGVLMRKLASESKPHGVGENRGRSGSGEALRSRSHEVRGEQRGGAERMRESQSC